MSGFSSQPAKKELQHLQAFVEAEIRRLKTAIALSPSNRVTEANYQGQITSFERIRQAMENGCPE